MPAISGSQGQRTARLCSLPPAPEVVYERSSTNVETFVSRREGADHIKSQTGHPRLTNPPLRQGQAWLLFEPLPKRATIFMPSHNSPQRIFSILTSRGR